MSVLPLLVPLLLLYFAAASQGAVSRVRLKGPAKPSRGSVPGVRPEVSPPSQGAVSRVRLKGPAKPSRGSVPRARLKGLAFCLLSIRGLLRSVTVEGRLRSCTKFVVAGACGLGSFVSVLPLLVPLPLLYFAAVPRGRLAGPPPGAGPAWPFPGPVPDVRPSGPATPMKFDSRRLWHAFLAKLI